MKKKSLKKFDFKVKTISNLQNEVSGGRYSPIANNSYENSCMAGHCKSINEHTLCCVGTTQQN